VPDPWYWNGTKLQRPGNEAGERVGSIKTAWGATCRRAGVAALHFHDLRREFGSRLIEAPGVHPALVRDWLGHASITTTSRYLTTSAHGLLDAARKFEASRAAFAHDSHKEGDGDEAAAIEQNTEVVESNGIEVVSRLGIEPRTRRLRVCCSAN